MSTPPVLALHFCSHVRNHGGQLIDTAERTRDIFFFFIYFTHSSSLSNPVAYITRAVSLRQRGGADVR